MDTSNTADLAGLFDRLPHVGRLLEHQLWEAARGLSLDRSSRQGRRFAGLVEAGATLDAVLLLVALSKPERSVSSIGRIGERWLCSIHVTPQERARLGSLSSHRGGGRAGAQRSRPSVVTTSVADPRRRRQRCEHFCLAAKKYVHFFAFVMKST